MWSNMSSPSFLRKAHTRQIGTHDHSSRESAVPSRFYVIARNAGGERPGNASALSPSGSAAWLRHPLDLCYLDLSLSIERLSQSSKRVGPMRGFSPGLRL